MRKLRKAPLAALILAGLASSALAIFSLPSILPATWFNLNQSQQISVIPVPTLSR